MKFFVQMNVKRGPMLQGWSGEDVQRMVDYMR